MTTNIRTLIVLLIVTLAGVVGASAQTVSLFDIGHEVYKSEADGFEIALPPACVKMTPTATGRKYVCEVKEGSLSVLVASVDVPMTTDAERAAFLKVFKEGMEDSGVKVVSETPVHIGDYRGATFQISVDGDKAYAVAMTTAKFFIVIQGFTIPTVPNAAKLISDAVQSFTITAKAK